MTPSKCAIMGSVAFIVVCLLAAPALAQSGAQLDSADRAAMEQCLQSAAERGARPDECIGFVQNPCFETEEGQTTMGSVECISRELAYWDGLLNQSYRRLRETGTDEQNAGLRDLQRQWLAWREARCDYEAALYEGGSLANVVANQCFTQETARRAIDLTAMIQQGDDDYRLRD